MRGDSWIHIFFDNIKLYKNDMLLTIAELNFAIKQLTCEKKCHETLF